MLDYLDMNYDEEWLRSNYLPKKLRCASSVQSYSIYDSKEYFDAFNNNLLRRAEMILKNPFMQGGSGKQETKIGKDGPPDAKYAEEPEMKSANKAEDA